MKNLKLIDGIKIKNLENNNFELHLIINVKRELIE